MQPQPEPEPEGDAAQPPLEDENTVLERATLKLNTCKIIVAGDGRAGKTSLLRNLRREPFDPEEESTRGVAACTVDVREESWDDAEGGATSYESKLAQVYRREAQPEPEPDAAEPEPDLSPAPRRTAAPTAAAPAAEKPREPLSLHSDQEETVQTGEGMPLTLEVQPKRGLATVTCVFQWHKDGEPMDGATETRLTIESATQGHAGVYFCVAESDGETVRSQDKTVELVESQPIQLTEKSPDESWLIAGKQKELLSIGVDV
eukprot:COSAG04_NODE_8893_length_920_cov_0.866017_1_plen_260_part_10